MLSPAFMFWIQFILVLGAILIGIRKGGVALGLIGGLGVALLVLFFRVAPGTPPVDVMLIILAVVTASATLQVAGGLDYLVQLTERLLRAHPKYVTILAPLSTFFLTVCVGTGHAVYALLPVISDVALKTRIRPERPMAISSVASQMGITASPVAAAVTTFLAMAAKNGHPVGLFDIVRITLPAGVIGVLAAAAWSFNRGKELDQDPEFLARMKDPDFAKGLEGDVTTLDKVIPFKAKLSVGLFFAGVLTIVLLALKPGLLPMANGKPIPMTTVVQVIMLPFGYALGLPTNLLLGLIPASYAYFFFAFYPSDLAAINMDRTGTTRIGKYLLDHSFMIPGLIGVSVSTCVAFGLSKVLA